MSGQLILEHHELSRSYIDQIRKTTQVLKDHFGISGMSFCRIGYDNNFCVLTDVPQLSEYMVEQNAHLTSTYLRHPDSFRSGFIINDEIANALKQNIIKIENESFCLTNTLIFIEKTKDGTECCMFWGKKDNKSLNHLGMNHQQLVRKFVEHMKKEHALFLERAREAGIDLAKTMPENYYANTKPTNMLSEQALFELLQQFGISSLLEKYKRLSQSERHCLRYVVQGKSAQQTAALLPFSPRTIETYLANARRKLNCKNKSELFSIADELAKFNLL